MVNSQSEFMQQVLDSLEKSVVAFNAGRRDFFDDFAEDAVIFTADCREPIKGRDAYREGYQSILASGQRQKTIVDRNVQIVGDKAVVKQTAQIVEADATADVVQTLVYGQTGEGVKVLHSHTALLTPKTGSHAIEVVDERIATTAMVIGVAQ